MTAEGSNEPEIEALRVDRYLESILLARDRGAPATPYDPNLDPELRSIAGRLSAELVRVHPSFRFEERLARRLNDLAATIRAPMPAAVGAEAAGAESATSRVVPIRAAGNLDPNELFDPADLLDPVRRGVANDDDPLNGRARPYLIGGALTSAAISLAGAAFVAWRLTRPFHRRPGHETGLA